MRNFIFPDNLLKLFTQNPILSVKTILIVFAALSLASGCTKNPATGKKSFTAFMSKEQEKRVGAEEHPKILKQFGGEYRKEPLNSYINHLGKKLAAKSEIPGLPYRFFILNTPQVNAFALPGGYIYLTRGLLALANSEAEVAGVLAHEIGHITARHSAQRYSTAVATNIGLNVFGVIGSAAGLPTGVGQAVSFGANAAIQSYSRNQELEADMLGVRYMTQLGYSPTAMTSFFKSLDSHSKLLAQQRGKKNIRHDIMSTHPRTKDRITQAIRMAQTKISSPPILRRSEYLAQIDGMVFGDSLKQGIIRDHRFIHPNLRFTFMVPPGYVLFNSPRKVTAYGSHKSLIEFSMVSLSKKGRRINLDNYLFNIWGRNIPLKNLETLNINGLAAKTAVGQISNGGRKIRLVVIRGTTNELYRFVFVTPVNPPKMLLTELQRTTYSFRLLSLQEAREAQPLRIKIKTLGKGATFNSILKEMTAPNPEYSQGWFELLNNTKASKPLAPGVKIKLVVE